MLASYRHKFSVAVQLQHLMQEVARKHCLSCPSYMTATKRQKVLLAVDRVHSYTYIYTHYDTRCMEVITSPKKATHSTGRQLHDGLYNVVVVSFQSCYGLGSGTRDLGCNQLDVLDIHWQKGKGHTNL